MHRRAGLPSASPLGRRGEPTDGRLFPVHGKSAKLSPEEGIASSALADALGSRGLRLVPSSRLGDWVG